MERRVLIAVLLSFLVLLAYQTLVVKPRTRPAEARRTAPAQGGAAQPTPPPTVPLEPLATPPPPPASAVTIGDASEREIVVETDVVRAVVSNRGGVLKSWQLKKYLDSSGRPLDMVARILTDPALKPFALSTADPKVTQVLNGALYRASADQLDLGATAGRLALEFQDVSGLTVRKDLEFQPNGQRYIVRTTVTVTLQGRPERVFVSGGAGFGDFERGVKPSGFMAVSSYQPPQAIFQLGPDVSRVAADTLMAQPVREGPFRYIGVDDHYFLAALLSGGRQTRVEYRPHTIAASDGPRTIVEYRVRESGDPPLTFFYGPKEFDVLQDVDAHVLQTSEGALVRTIHFGVFGFLATPLLKSLKWIDARVGNYGWSIILLTVCINLLMFPLRHKSAVSMRKMQEIQPQVKAIQDKYAKYKTTDPARQKMNTELMGLYRERGVNPASGCVPMLLTFPVLFAFYALLSVAIELRGAPWIGWIKDLSTADPLFITPVLMGVSQFWQTKMMPATGDPTQQRMMMFMPLMFMVFFLWAPSGLVIYWLVSNVWTIGQQYLTNHLIGSTSRASGKR